MTINNFKKKLKEGKNLHILEANSWSILQKWELSLSFKMFQVTLVNLNSMHSIFHTLKSERGTRRLTHSYCIVYET